MMEISEGRSRVPIQTWQSQVAQPQVQPQVQTQQPQMDYGYNPYDFQGGEGTQATGGDEDYMSFVMPGSLKRNFGVGGGGAVDFSDFDVESMKELFPELMLKDINDQAIEQAGLGGTRWSSVLGQKIADANARATETWAADMFAKWIASQEAAKQRGLSARTSSAGNALRMAQFNATLPMHVASMMANLGGQTQEAEMGPWSVAYQDWMRTTPEGSMGTYGNALINMLGQEPGGPTQYQPGLASNLMGLGSSLLPFVGGGGGGGGASQYENYSQPYFDLAPMG